MLQAVDHRYRPLNAKIQGQFLTTIMTEFRKTMQELIAQATSKGARSPEGWTQGGVMADVSRWFFDAQLAALFGPVIDKEQLYKDFVAFGM